MIINILRVFYICVAILFFGCEHEKPSVKATLARSLIRNVAKNLEQRYQLRFIGFSESADKAYYNKIGLRFSTYRILRKEEGREILIESAEHLMNEINSNTDLQPYLNPYPFTAANVEVVIFVHKQDESSVYYPNIAVFAAWSERVEYKTKIEEVKYGYYTEEEESYEEALKIVRSQN
ncbi:MAG: hypothetical protein H0U49_07135 [Parachlamydiaceae bacterium]|nr:hypothetical protein [Parachlamydiaceae bacterium]